MDRDGKALAGRVGRADLWAAGEMAQAHRVGGRTEVEAAAIEDPVDRADDRAVVGSHGGHDEQAPPGEPVRDPARIQPALREVDAEEVRPAPR